MALGAGLLASLSSLALSVGALGLLVESARRPGLAAVLGVLIVIELLAFLRSPIRYAERMSAHRLGLAAVTHWRRWLMLSVGRWPYRRWRQQASGDLLERALRDTDELQDLWLRAVIPAASAAGTALVGDLVLGLLPARSSWWPSAGVLGACQVLSALAILAHYPRLVASDRLVRESRGRYRATLVELGGAVPELSLLHREDFAQARCAAAGQALARAEQRRQRRARTLGLAGPLGSAGALLGVLATRPAAAPVWVVVATLLALSSLEYASAWRAGVETAVAVSGAAERLDELAPAGASAEEPWPARGRLELSEVSVFDGGPLVHAASLHVEPGEHVGLVGPSGAGKSALLRVAVGLDEASGG